MRTVDEIVKQIETIRESDFFGFTTSDLLVFLPYDKAKQFLTAKAIEDVESGKEPWPQQELSRDAIVKCIGDYMEFAWGKANNCRGLSASRSVDHMSAWTWLLGESEQELYEFVSSDENYYHYGKPILEKICDHFGLDYTEWDNGLRGDDEDSQVPKDVRGR